MGLMNAFQIHGNRVLKENQFTGFILLPAFMGVIGLLLLYISQALEAVPILGSILNFVGALWTMIPMFFFAYLGWLWFISFIYLFIISLWLIDITNKYDGDPENKFNYKTEKYDKIDLGKSYTSKRIISLTAALLITVSIDDFIGSVVSVLDFYGNDFSDRTWTPWKGYI